MKVRVFFAAAAALLAAQSASAAEVLDWNKSNVDVGTTPADGVTGSSVVYDQVLLPGGVVPPTATTNGRIVFTPPEAVSPGIKVLNTPYPDSGPGSLVLDGCIMTSSGAGCTDPFQSGKRIKQQMTGTGPVDLVFDVDPNDTTTSTYQVFGRLINLTGQSLKGFDVQLGFGLGDDFVAADATSGLSFSTEFTAQPTGSGSSNSQFPFGLFGDASTNPNFLLDGFFDNERTGLQVSQTATTLAGIGYFGNYFNLFGHWRDQADVPLGLFWDFDDDDATDALLMAWEISPGVWELRRETGETCDLANPSNCTDGKTLSIFEQGSFDDIVARLGVDAALLDVGAIEDLANLNLNYAITLGDLGGASSFTLRTTVSAVPLPATAPLLAGAFGIMMLMRRRQSA